MAKADPSIDPRILESARTEFLAVGFEKASLKTICEKASVTTGALYKRYKGKDELFCAVVAPALNDLYAFVHSKSETPPAAQTDEQLIKAWDMDEDYMLWWFRYMFARQDSFVLLLKCAAGSSHANFQHDWVQVMTDVTYTYYQEAYRRGLAKTALSIEELHILLSAFWTTLYEPFIHGYTWEQIEQHSKLVCHLFNWDQVLGF